MNSQTINYAILAVVYLLLKFKSNLRNEGAHSVLFFEFCCEFVGSGEA